MTLYTAAGCPFCPIIEERLEALKNTMGFTLTKIDVTMRPDLLAAKKIKAAIALSLSASDGGPLTSRHCMHIIHI